MTTLIALRSLITNIDIAANRMAHLQENAKDKHGYIYPEIIANLDGLIDWDKADKLAQLLRTIEEICNQE